MKQTAFSPNPQISERLIKNEIPCAHDDKVLSFYLKRGADVTIALLLSALLLPIVLAVAAAIKLDSPGPALFSQDRVGSKRERRAGRTTWRIQPFRVWKFRTMAHNADSSVHQAYIKAFVTGESESPETGSGLFKLTDDPRITRVGRLLRRLSLDELPQLLNVLKGDMSLVGPRPVPLYEVEEYQEWHYERLAALPGITGLWQVKGRGRVPFDEMMQLDIEYVQRQSLWLDLRLVILTIPAVLSQRGAR